MTLLARIARDLLLIAVGVITYIDTPASLQELGIYGLLSKVWSLMLGLGAAASLLGVIRRRPRLEIMVGDTIGVLANAAGAAGTVVGLAQATVQDITALGIAA